ncbi:fatty acyl-CoA reductase 3-like [Lycium barbarum]|uniref:fatty acyl-CoA reductase 3-like n=1 Tax=Lycium barbarum TaxID=112863 RepID=UPI00293E652A|nr:fatty acyl-CoA reductase 3-like [Lycium barbarum]
MESRTIHQFLQGKTLLITGATGFLAKLLVEKILRVQPNVKKLYLLIRASDNNSARERFTDEVMKSELFNVIREKMSVNLCSLVEEKVFAISGDISYENMGIRNSELREEMCKEIDIIINSAATTNFYERYDVAMNVNVVGAMNVLRFAKSCGKLTMLLHVSTGYVCGKGKGVLLEKPFLMGETLNKISYLDMDVERDVIANKFKELEALNATSKEITTTMKELGIQRARLHGWQNTYTFTKAMGEMLLGHLKENLQVVIIRPTIITSTYKEPFPGWIEGVRTVDSFILAYGKGILNFFYGDPDSQLDVIPGDMVVNSILAAALAHGNQHSQEVVVYHISSSSRDPLKISNIVLFSFHYFMQNPWVNKDGKTIKVRAPMRSFSSMASFSKHISTHYVPLLKMLKFVNLVSCHCFDKTYRYMERKMHMVMRLSELYEPYVFFYGSFNDVNTERLRLAMKEINMDDVLNFDPRCIKWEDYLMYTHIPGVVKYLF